MDAKRVFLNALVIIVSWELWLFCLRNAWFKPVASEVSLSTMLGDVLSGPSPLQTGGGEGLPKSSDLRKTSQSCSS